MVLWGCGAPRAPALYIARATAWSRQSASRECAVRSIVSRVHVPIPVWRIPGVVTIIVYLLTCVVLYCMSIFELNIDHP